MKFSKFIFPLLVVTMLAASCSSQKVTQADVHKQVEKALEANAEAREASLKAVQARAAYTESYKKAELKRIDKRLNDIDREISNIESSKKRSTNMDATKALDTAIAALKMEESQLNKDREDIAAIRAAYRSQTRETIESSTATIDQSLNKLEDSLSDLD